MLMSKMSSSMLLRKLAYCNRLADSCHPSDTSFFNGIRCKLVAELHMRGII